MKSTNFTIGSTQFAAIRSNMLRPHWVLHILEIGAVFGSGTGGISNESVPKMKADIQRLLVEVSKGDVTDFRRRFDLPAEPVSPLPKVMILDYGYSGIAIERGFTAAGSVRGTNDEILAGYSDKDNMFVRLDSVPGNPKINEYAKYARCVAVSGMASA